jgi:hypothetical protein
MQHFAVTEFTPEIKIMDKAQGQQRSALRAI